MPTVLHPEIRIALLIASDRPPIAFPDLSRLARRIHAERRGRGLQLAPVAVTLPCENRTRVMVAVHALDGAGERTDLIGYAWLGGGEADRDKLQAALTSLRPATLGRIDAEAA